MTSYTRLRVLQKHDTPDVIVLPYRNSILLFVIMVSSLVVSTIVSALSLVISVLNDLPTPNGYQILVRMIFAPSNISAWNNNSIKNSASSPSSIPRRMQCGDILRNRASTMRSIRTFLSYIICTVLLHHYTTFIQPVNATLFVNNNTYATLPALFGRFMVDGKTYEARLQYFHDNPYLCDIDDKTLQKFVPPTGGIQINHFGGSNLTIYEESVALLVVRGNCPFQKKAAIAELIDDSIKVLLIANFNLDNVPEEDEILVPMISDLDTRLVLVGISHATGQALKKYLSEIPADINKLGGPIIHFDSNSPYENLSEEDLESMMLSALGIFFMLISFTGCLVILTGTYHQLLMQHQNGGDNPLTAATQRRLLTEEEVQQFTTALRSGHVTTNRNGINIQESLPPFSTSLSPSRSSQRVTNTLTENDITLDNVDADQCAVCLGEFDDDEDIAILPCHHKFHSTCITPWLTERQSKCPLCKFDVLQHIRDQPTASTAATADASSERAESDAQPVSPESETTPIATVSFLDHLRRYRWTSIATRNNDDIGHRRAFHLDGIMRVVEVLSANDLIVDFDDDDDDYDYDNDDRRRGSTSNFEMTEPRRNVL